jgi:hypothetical protein
MDVHRGPPPAGTTGLAACAESSMLSAQDGFHSAQALPRGSSRHRPAKSSVPRAPTNPLSTPVPRGIYNSRQKLLKRVKKKQKAQHGPTPSPAHRGRTSGATATTSPPPFTLPERHFATHAGAIHAPCSHSRHARHRHSRSLQPQPPHTPPDIRGRRRTPPPWPSAAPSPDLEKERESK